jgi:hypothetical protein
MSRIVIVTGDRSGSFYKRHRKNSEQPLYAEMSGGLLKFFNRCYSTGLPAPPAFRLDIDMVEWMPIDPDTHPELWAGYCAWRMLHD